MTKFFEKPTQVKFLDRDNDIWVGGIAYKNEIICGYCGGIVDIDDLKDNEIVVYDHWVSISDETIGE